MMVEESSNRVLEFAGAAVNAAAQLPFGKKREPAFDQVKPGTTGRGEVQTEARVPQQPTLDGRRLVRSVVVKNQVHVHSTGHACVNGCQEIAKLDCAVAPMELADNGAGLGVERSEQVDSAITHVIRRAALGLAGSHRQHRLTPIEGLNLRLLVHAQHQCLIRRIEIQAHDVAHLLDEQRVLGKLEALDPVRLQPKGTPDAADRALTQSAALGHRARTPVSRIGGGAFQGEPHHSLNLRITDLTRRPRAWLIEQTIQTAVQKALPPFADGLWGYPEFACNHHVGVASRALQHNSRPLCQCLRTRRPSRPTLQALALFNRQTQRCYRSPRPHPRPSSIWQTRANCNLFNALKNQDTSASYGMAYRFLAPIAYPRIKEIAEQTISSRLIYLNSHAADFKTPELRPYVDRYLRGSNGYDAVERVKLLKLLWDAVGSEFGGRHELYERNYAGNYEVIRLENLPSAIATGADKIRKFVDSFMAEYDLDGWLAPDLINPTDINVTMKRD